jgi:hypothetical protein
VTHEEERLLALSLHYGNAKLYITKLRDALERIQRVASSVKERETKSAGLTDKLFVDVVHDIAKTALEAHPPHPLAHFYDEGIHTGHPYPEYLDLPVGPGDDYVDVHAHIMTARKGGPMTNDTQLRIEYDDDPEKILDKVNAALRPVGLTFADDGLPHDGFILCRLKPVEAET